MSESLPPLQGGPTRGLLGMPSLPVVGFRRRLVALILDLMLASLAIRLISSLLSPLAIASGEYWSYITATLFFAYFALLNGPLGGATLGKRVMRIRVTDAEGGPSTLRHGLIRTAVLLPIFPLTPIATMLVGHGGDLQAAYWWQVIAVFPFFAVVIATALVIPFNPFKQGIHDFLAHTLVRPVDGSEPVSFTEMTAIVGNQWTKFHRQPQISGGVTIALIFTMMCFLFHPSRLPDDYRALRTSQHQLTQIPGFARAQIGVVPTDKAKFLEAPQFGSSGSDVSAEMMSRGPSDNYTSGTVSLVLEVVRNDKWTFDPTDPNYRPYVEAMADGYHKNIFPHAVRIKFGTGHPLSQEEAVWWNEMPVELSFVFLRVVTSVPPLFMHREPVGTFVKRYPPLLLELPELSSSAGSGQSSE